MSISFVFISYSSGNHKITENVPTYNTRGSQPKAKT